MELCRDLFFFFNDTATTEIYTLSLHDALPICQPGSRQEGGGVPAPGGDAPGRQGSRPRAPARSEEHTSELQSQSNLVCRLLLEKKKTHINPRRQRVQRASQQYLQI